MIITFYNKETLFYADAQGLNQLDNMARPEWDISNQQDLVTKQISKRAFSESDQDLMDRAVLLMMSGEDCITIKTISGEDILYRMNLSSIQDEINFREKALTMIENRLKEAK